jgi:hypothetical protein
MRESCYELEEGDMNMNMDMENHELKEISSTKGSDGITDTDTEISEDEDEEDYEAWATVEEWD